MLTIFIITLFTLSVSMIIVAYGIEKKEQKSIECELSQYCEIEKSKNCKPVMESSINYLTMIKDVSGSKTSIRLDN